MKQMSDSFTEAWDAIAEDWIRHTDSNDYRNFFLLPTTLSMLGDVLGKRILDLGCGEGGYSREMARLGADVTGIDGSPRLIEEAVRRAEADNLSIRHLVQNASKLTELEDSVFDIVIASMSLMDVFDYDGAIRETHRVLKPRGDLLMSILHPCFSSPVAQWHRDESGNLEVFVVDQYFSRITQESFITDEFGKPTPKQHKPLEDFINPLIRRGFRLMLFSEPVPTEEQLKKSSRFSRLFRIPYFLFMKWVKEIENQTIEG